MKLTIKNRFGIAPNELLNNPNISFKAKGLFAYIQSKPDGWDFSVERIQLETKDGRESIISGLQELENEGYLSRNKYQDEKGYWQIEYILRENPASENPTTGNPPKENPQINKKIVKKKYIQINNNTEEASLSPKNEVNLLLDFFKQNINPHINFGNKTERKAADDLIKKYSLEMVKKVLTALEQKRKTDKYIPTVTTPYELYAKWAKIGQHLKQKERKIVWNPDLSQSYLRPVGHTTR